MVAQNCIPRTPAERYAAALNGDETIPGGTLVRLRTNPRLGPFVVACPVTREVYGGDCPYTYELIGMTLTGAGLREYRFEVDPANVFIQPGDNPEPAIARAPQPAASAGQSARQSAHDPRDFGTAIAELLVGRPRFIPQDDLTSATADGRFVITRQGGLYITRDNVAQITNGTLYTRHAAELWCRMQLANDRPPVTAAPR